MNQYLRNFFLFNALFVFASNLFGPLYAVFVEEIGAGVISISYSWAVYLLSMTVVTFIVAKVGDKFKNKSKLIAVSFLMKSMIFALYLLVDSVQMLLIVQALLGISDALWSPAFNVLFAEHLDRNKHIQEYSDWIIIANLVMAVAVVLGGFIVAKCGFSYLFVSMSFLSFVSFMGILLQKN